jgi:hypothetical protein
MNPQQNSIRTKWSMAIHVAVLISATTVTVVGQTEDVIYRFLGANGYHPEGGLISDSAGDRFIFRPTVALTGRGRHSPSHLLSWRRGGHRILFARRSAEGCPAMTPSPSAVCHP